MKRQYNGFLALRAQGEVMLLMADHNIRNKLMVDGYRTAVKR
jgi:hypothetical protein